MPRYRAEVLFTFEATGLTEGGRRLRELSSAAESAGFSLERARVDDAPPPAGDADGWTSYAPLEPETSTAAPPGEPPGQSPRPTDPGPPIAVRLDDLLLGDLGHQRVDARLLQALLLRDGRVGKWLSSQGIDVDAVQRAFPGTGRS